MPEHFNRNRYLPTVYQQCIALEKRHNTLPYTPNRDHGKTIVSHTHTHKKINSNYTQQLYPISHILHPSQRPSNRIKDGGGNNIIHWFVKTIHCGQVGILKPDVRTGVDLIAKPQKKNLSITGY